MREWEEKDQQKAELLALAKPRTDIQCNKCEQIIVFDFKTDWSEQERERVLLFYVCPNKCLPHRTFFDNGEEYFTKLTTCKECGGKTRCDGNRSNNTITTTWTCIDCDHKDVDEYNLHSSSKEKEEPINEAHRKEYCLDEENLEKHRRMKYDIDAFVKLAKDMQARQEDTKTNKRMEIIQRLRVAGLKDLIVKKLEPLDMTTIEFSTPTNNRGLKIRITMIDSNQERSDAESKKIVKKALIASLRKTNWRLVKTSLESTLGAITGELRGYTSDEELRRIIERENNTNKKQRKC